MDAHRPWLAAYPPGVPADIDADRYASLVELMEEAFLLHSAKTAYSYLDRDFSFHEIDAHSRHFAAYLQGLGLSKGARVAIMMPNVAQYPIAVAGILRAGLVLVNVNPLYTARELAHQLLDSGASAIVIMENFAHTLQTCLAQHPNAIAHTIVASMGDRLGWLRGALVNGVVRHVKQLVPAFQLPQATTFNTALQQGQKRPMATVALQADDLAVLQYTGGTTGVSKGAMLSHRNIVANVLQSEAWNAPAMQTIPSEEQPTSVCALPLYHIFAFTINMMLGMRTGAKNILLPNPRDLPAVLKTLARQPFHTFPAVNTLFSSLARHPDFHTVDWSHLRLSVGGGSAVQRQVAQLWLEQTGCPICEGYGLSETSPSVTCNPVTSKTFTGTIGLPLPSTWVQCVDGDGMAVAEGEVGEIAIRGPQVMLGYWQRPDETAQVTTAHGYLLTGDMGVMDATGYVRLVDRKKDMILVSGFNVFPNEVEDTMMELEGILECAAVGIPDDQSGEAVKLVVVRQNEHLSEADIHAFSHANLTGYKRPKIIEFRTELPKTPVGKVLRRRL